MTEAHDPNQTVDTSSTPPDSLDVGLAAGFGRPADGPGSVLTELRSRLGPLQPVLLGEAEGESGHIVKPKSDAMPPPEHTGDRYQLSGEIARGGMGAVLRGRDVDLGRDLAVKVLLEKYADRPEVARRFLEEAQVGAQLQHPGVVPVYDIGRFGALPFFTMKLVKGQTLAALLSARSDPSVDRPRLLGIVLQVSQTLAYAHAKGVIHRDLKPANVMVGAFGEVQVMDWGLAKVLTEGGVADEERTASRVRQRPENVTTIRTTRSGTAGSGTDTEAGTLLGTPAYMPPEQANGDVAHLDRRADVFGLGAILCEILTGKPPYVGRSNEEVRRKACNGDLADTRARLNACGADGELLALTLACLAPEACDRPRDARVVADALTADLDGVQERLHQAELAEAEAKAKAVEEVKRRRLTLALAGTVLLAVTLGGGGWLYVKSERDARLAQMTRDVNDALNQATALREKAKVGTAGGAALFAQAREQAQRALALVENGPAEAALAAQVRQLQAELDEEEKDRKMIAALEEAHLAEAETVAGENRFASERALPKFEAAFREYGLGVGEIEAGAAAQRIRQRPAAVREAIVSALDEWDSLAANPRFGISEPHRAWLRAVLAGVEPEDGLGRQVRAAFAEKDAAKRRAALEQLAASADVDKVPLWALTRLTNPAQYADADALRPTEAVKLLRRAQARYPADFWVNHNLGLALQRLTPPEYVEAVRFLTAAVALRPDSPGAHYNLGSALYLKGRVDEAIACYRKALELDPKYASAHNNLGTVLHAKGLSDEAIACYRKALALDPKDAAAHYNLGNVLQRKGEVDGAIACYRKAIEINPKFAPAHHNLGRALVDKRQLDEAIACWRKAIELDPKLGSAYHNLGLALADKGQLNEAIASLRKAIALDPKLALAHTNLGLRLAGKGRLDEAIACFRQAIELDPKQALAHTSLGTALARKGQVDEAIACWRKAIALDPKLALAHTNLGNALREKGLADEAIACHRRALELDPKDAAAHYNLGKSLARKGQVDQAIACYQKATTLDPKHAAAHNDLGGALASKGELDQAIACFRKAIEHDPKPSPAYTNLGKALQSKGQVDEAIACHRTAITLDPKYPVAHFNLGNALAGKGQVDQAIACFQKAIALDPKYAMAHTNLGSALYLKGRVDEAIACCRKAIALDPKEPVAHCYLGHALARQGRFAEALASFKRGHELGTKQPGWRYPTAQWVREAERLATLEAKLPNFLKGEFQPKNAAERLGLAAVCQAKKLHRAAAGLYAATFATDPKLANDLRVRHRYSAACAAALAAAGQGEDAAKLKDKEQARLRKQALDWLRADLSLWTKRLESGQPDDRAEVQRVLRHWQKDADLVGLRDKAALAKLQPEVRAAYERLWADVAALLKKAGEETK
jgi:serine/threonine-protein kinase